MMPFKGRVTQDMLPNTVGIPEEPSEQTGLLRTVVFSLTEKMIGKSAYIIMQDPDTGRVLKQDRRLSGCLGEP